MRPMPEPPDYKDTDNLGIICACLIMAICVIALTVAIYWWNTGGL